MSDRPLALGDPRIAEAVAPVQFHSATYRLFRIDGLESACEDYGQAVGYLGTVPDASHRFVLDKHHNMETGRLFPVCGNT